MAPYLGAKLTANPDSHHESRFWFPTYGFSEACGEAKVRCHEISPVLVDRWTYKHNIYYFTDIFTVYFVMVNLCEKVYSCDTFSNQILLIMLQNRGTPDHPAATPATEDSFIFS